ncbi:predicted host inhibitor [Salmonella phage Vi06]|uniref:Predicted host inhibitor n=1 Tax=Salmonella phage Vi06 TaxID=866889 RepID=E1XU85_9CAUD|nr:dGTPase inhibitor; target for F exclusion [Salmonella phage Vi06]CBV65204.1 predicted host inhibitor [Salmonella phage Vi06]
MGHLYSGSISDFKAATGKLLELDFVVKCDDWYSSHMGSNFMCLHIEDMDGNSLITNIFCHYDEDILYSMCTEWLNRMYDQLKDWK